MIENHRKSFNIILMPTLNILSMCVTLAILELLQVTVQIVSECPFSGR